jgi:hypothetical protein
MANGDEAVFGKAAAEKARMRCASLANNEELVESSSSVAHGLVSCDVFMTPFLNVTRFVWTEMPRLVMSIQIGWRNSSVLGDCQIGINEKR